MSDTGNNLYIRWKGVDSGPYSRAEIEEMLVRGEISLVHAIEVNGRWTNVAQYVRRARLRVRPSEENVSAHPVAPAQSEALAAEEFYSGDGDAEIILPEPKPVDYDKLIQIGYILCGAAFVLPVLATIPAGMIALRLRAAGFHEPAKFQLMLCAGFTVFGFLFWLVLIFAG